MRAKPHCRCHSTQHSCSSNLQHAAPVTPQQTRSRHLWHAEPVHEPSATDDRASSGTRQGCSRHVQLAAPVRNTTIVPDICGAQNPSHERSANDVQLSSEENTTGMTSQNRSSLNSNTKRDFPPHGDSVGQHLTWQDAENLVRIPWCRLLVPTLTRNQTRYQDLGPTLQRSVLPTEIAFRSHSLSPVPSNLRLEPKCNVHQSRRESLAASGKHHQSRQLPKSCVQLIKRAVQQHAHLGSQQRASPNAASRPQRHLQRKGVTARSRGKTSLAT